MGRRLARETEKVVGQTSRMPSRIFIEGGRGRGEAREASLVFICCLRRKSKPRCAPKRCVW